MSTVRQLAEIFKIDKSALNLCRGVWILFRAAVADARFDPARFGQHCPVAARVASAHSHVALVARKRSPLLPLVGLHFLCTTEAGGQRGPGPPAVRVHQRRRGSLCLDHIAGRGCEAMRDARVTWSGALYASVRARFFMMSSRCGPSVAPGSQADTSVLLAKHDLPGRVARHPPA